MALMPVTRAAQGRQVPARGQLGPPGGAARVLLAAVSWLPELSWDGRRCRCGILAAVQCPGPGVWLLWLRLLGEAPGVPPAWARGWHCPQACSGVALYLRPLSTCHPPLGSRFCLHPAGTSCCPTQPAEVLVPRACKGRDGCTRAVPGVGWPPLPWAGLPTKPPCAVRQGPEDEGPLLTAFPLASRLGSLLSSESQSCAPGLTCPSLGARSCSPGRALCGSGPPAPLHMDPRCRSGV